tara:strand:+ start:10 stop:483 length:474 start_codon:yes stop_codon:yes gene_type:complete
MDAEGWIERATELNVLATEELNAWSAATRKATTWDYSGDYFYKRSAALMKLSKAVSAGQRYIDAQKLELQMELEKLNDQRKQLEETLLVHPEPAKCVTELVQSNSREHYADFKVVCSMMTMFNVNKGWLYSSRTPIYTTWFRNGGHAIKHINHTPTP